MLGGVPGNETLCGPVCRPNVGLVIEGAALAVALLRWNAPPFLQLCEACRGVVCCRVTPMQKAQVVALVKKTGAITLGQIVLTHAVKLPSQTVLLHQDHKRPSSRQSHSSQALQCRYSWRMHA